MKKTLFLFSFLMLVSTAWGAGLIDILPSTTVAPTPTVTPTPTPVVIPVDPPVAVPTDKGIVLIIKSILLKPDGVCFVVIPQ